jgi:hypothetical protein
MALIIAMAMVIARAMVMSRAMAMAPSRLMGVYITFVIKMRNFPISYSISSFPTVSMNAFIAHNLTIVKPLQGIPLVTPLHHSPHNPHTIFQDQPVTFNIIHLPFSIQLMLFPSLPNIVLNQRHFRILKHRTNLNPNLLAHHLLVKNPQFLTKLCQLFRVRQRIADLGQELFISYRTCFEDQVLEGWFKQVLRELRLGVLGGWEYHWV